MSETVRVRGFRALLGALAAAVVLLCFWVLLVEAPARLTQRAVEVFRRQKAQMARQGADRLGAVIGEIRRRLSDPLVLAGSRLEAAVTPEELEAALGRLVRPWDMERGLVLFVVADDGEVLAVAPECPGRRAAVAEKLAGHVHRPPRETEHGISVCAACLQAFGAVSVHSRVGSGWNLVANLNVERLAAETLGRLRALEGGEAWLVDEQGRPLHGTTSQIGHPGIDDSSLLREDAVLPEGSPAWRVVVAVPRDAVLGAVRSQVFMLEVIATGLLALILLGLLGYQRREGVRHRGELRQVERLAHQDKLATLGLLAAGMSHEMRSGLGLSLSLLDFARSDSGEEAVREQLAEVRSEVARLMELSDELTRYSRQRHEERVCRISLEEVVEEALQILRPELGPVREVERELDPELEVWATRGALGQVVVNLLLNAVQALAEHPEGRIRVTSEQEGERVVLVVEDNGDGLPEGGEDEVFHPFFTTKPEGEGTGLGLWICRTLVANLGGDIRAGRGAKGGARFEVRLPRVGDAVDVQCRERGEVDA